jgi:hypothetical protein
MPVKPALLVHGMHGLGDNLHQRALLRQLMPHHDVTLESSWVAPYHDLVGQGLKVVHKHMFLRTSRKNAAREAALFTQASPPPGTRAIKVWYRPDEVRKQRSVLGAMCAATGRDYASADFRLPIPQAWADRAEALIASWQPAKPLLIYRPLVERTEWGGCATRNPDHAGYAAIFASLREKFFVASIADLVDGVEWMVGDKIEADVELHRGELDFETMAALFARANLVFCSPGFAVILGQAVGTPVICSFGRYERAYSFSAGARFSPYLGIEPINPCDDFKHDDTSDKTIDIAAAIGRAAVFASAAAERHAARPLYSAAAG